MWNPKSIKFGWQRDLPDARDLPFAMPPKPPEGLPKAVDLGPQCPPVLDQGTTSSCTAQAICNAHLFAQMQQKHGDPMLPSRLMLYYEERRRIGTIYSDSGARIRDGFKVIRSGVCPEPYWEWNESRLYVKPLPACYDMGKKWQSLEYRRIPQSLDALRACLAAGWPIVDGIAVYDSLMTDEVKRTGIAPMPNLKTERNLGGHCTLTVGYDDDRMMFRKMNSWTKKWGDNGFFWVPYPYMQNPGLACDFWVLTRVECGE